MKKLNEVNPYVKNFRMAKDRFESNKDEPLHIRIVSNWVGIGLGLMEG